MHATQFIKKFLLSTFVIASVAGYSFKQKGIFFMHIGDDEALPLPISETTNTNTSTAASADTNQNGSSTPPANTNTAPVHTNSGAATNTTTNTSGNTNQAPAPAPAPTGQYKNGRYTSGVQDAYYGNVQIKLTVSSGKMTAVSFLQYPNTHSNSIYINQQAMPLLSREAIAAQSANVNIVTGATFTSQAFRKAMQDIVAQAKA